MLRYPCKAGLRQQFVCILLINYRIAISVLNLAGIIPSNMKTCETFLSDMPTINVLISKYLPTHTRHTGIMSYQAL